MAFAPGEAAYLTRESATTIALQPRDAADATPRVVGMLGEVAPAVAEAHGLEYSPLEELVPLEPV